MYEREKELPPRRFKPPASARLHKVSRSHSGDCSCSETSAKSMHDEGFGHTFARVPILAQAAGPAAGPATAPLPDIKTDFDDCPKPWQDKIKETAGMARNWVNFSIGKIDAMLANPNAPAVKTQDMLKTHFHVGTGGPKEKVFDEVVEIRSNFVKIQAGFGGTLPFECETSCDPKYLGYILPGPLKLFRGMSDIHLCPLWFNDNLMEQVNTIIHEMAHKYAHRADEAYEGSDKYSKLTVDDAIDNADSYAAFAEHI
jgi:hypothetical protein